MLVPNARKPAVTANNNAVVERTLSTTAARDQATRQRTGGTEIQPVVDFVQARPDVEGTNVGGLTRQFNSIFNRVSVESAVEKPAQAQGSIQSAAQRGAAAYADVATLEHRDELVALLGIDVFA